MSVMGEDTVVYKKAILRGTGDSWDGFKTPTKHVIVKLLIPAGTAYVKPSGKTTGWDGYPLRPYDLRDERKSRAARAKVLGVYTITNPKDALCALGRKATRWAKSQCDSKFVYRPGRYVEPRRLFDSDEGERCASGVHFFFALEDALAYDL